MPTRPNILLIVADQMAAGLTGAYGGPARTPAMDALAAGGARFDAAYTPCPLCTPARAALLTGRFPSRTRTYDNASILPADVPTWAHSLRSAGYEVVAAGKMHIVGPDQLHGVERRLTPDIYPTDFAWTPSDERYDAPPSTSGEKAEAARSAGPCDNSWQLDYDENVHRQALAFLRGRSFGSRPFCLVVSYTHPHPPYWAPRPFWDLYEGTDTKELWPPESEAAAHPPMDRWLQAFQGLSTSDRADAELLRRVRRAYLAMISYVDSRVGELLTALGELSLTDRTAVMLTSDHGEMLGSHGHVEKRLLYEQAVRVTELMLNAPQAALPTHAHLRVARHLHDKGMGEQAMAYLSDAYILARAADAKTDEIEKLAKEITGQDKWKPGPPTEADLEQLGIRKLGPGDSVTTEVDLGEPVVCYQMTSPGEAGHEGLTLISATVLRSAIPEGRYTLRTAYRAILSGGGGSSTSTPHDLSSPWRCQCGTGMNQLSWRTEAEEIGGDRFRITLRASRDEPPSTSP